MGDDLGVQGHVEGDGQQGLSHAVSFVHLPDPVRNDRGGPMLRFGREAQRPELLHEHIQKALWGIAQHLSRGGQTGDLFRAVGLKALEGLVPSEDDLSHQAVGLRARGSGGLIGP